MDHHCPWLNNCVGFYNRKYFMMLLMYAWFFVVALIAGSIPHLIWLLKDISQTQYEVERIKARYNLPIELGFLVLFFLTCCFLFILSNFYFFHLNLVFTNTTTLEHLEWEKEPEGKKPNLEKYDVGKYYNWVQVYGNNKLLWFIPITTQAGNPLGDGIVFATNPSVQLAAQAH